MAIELNLSVATSRLDMPLSHHAGIRMDMLRLDQIHPEVSGNKWFKLKAFLEEFKSGDYKGIVTFGGAYSNHLSATAAACHYYQIPLIAVIRGEELQQKENATLSFLKSMGATLIFMERSLFRILAKPENRNQAAQHFPKYLIVPEGGSGREGIQGASTIAQYISADVDTICLAVGTATTFCGIIEGAAPQQQILGFAALKQADYLQSYIKAHTTKTNWILLTDYHFGGFGKHTAELIDFMNQFRQTQGIPLDFVYTAKMMYGILDLIQKEHWQNRNILCIHSGGLQGNSSIARLLR